MRHKFTTLILLIFLTSSCGGVMGNIEKYTFENVSISDLKLAVKNVKLKYPELVLYDKSIYKEMKHLMMEIIIVQ